MHRRACDSGGRSDNCRFPPYLLNWSSMKLILPDKSHQSDTDSLGRTFLLHLILPPPRLLHPPCSSHFPLFFSTLHISCERLVFPCRRYIFPWSSHSLFRQP